MSTSLSLDSTRELIDDYIVRLFAKRRQESAILGSSYEALWTTMEKVAMAGGKRIRPYLTMLGHGSLDEKLVPIATAQELIHIAMLMHDDIIDQDFIRHGQENMNGVYREVYKKYLDDTRATHYANSAALLAGDALISESYRLVYASEYDETTKQHVLEQLNQSIFEVIGGELMDVEAGFRQGEVFDPMQIYRYKTSSYSFIGPIISGAYCCGANEKTIGILREFATNVGIAYQIQDDVLGVFGDEDETGKSTYTDLKEGKRTLLVKLHDERMNDEQRSRFERYFGDETASSRELKSIRDDMSASGAKDETLRSADRYFEHAYACLDQLVDDERHRGLRALTDSLKGRRK